MLGGKARATRTARVATPAERERLWPIVTAKYRSSAGDQKKTEQEILPVFLEVGGGSEVSLSAWVRVLFMGSRSRSMSSRVLAAAAGASAGAAGALGRTAAKSQAARVGRL